ncbi:MAG: T9SS type A sorting domain-containing protein [Lewinellaceae bacterium]|nr:T9SS type A sorting domain-containing protein [Lewinellaceae bacterium]
MRIMIFLLIGLLALCNGHLYAEGILKDGRWNSSVPEMYSWGFAFRASNIPLQPDTLTPPNGRIIYSPDCSTGGLGELFGFIVPTNPAATFLWTGPDGFSTQQARFAPADTGLYILTVFLDNCPSIPDTIHVQYFEPPMVEGSAPSDFYCPSGGSILLSAAANSETLFWRRLLPNGNFTYLGDGPSLPVPANLLGLPTERILVTANGDYGCEGIDTIQLTRLGSINAGSTLLSCPSDTATLSAAGEGAFLWNTGDTTSTIRVAVDSARTFTVRVVDGTGCIAQDSLSIFIDQGAYVALSAGQAALCLGDSTLLRAAGGDSYLWENGSSADSLLVAPLETDTFSVIITTAQGCVVEKAINVHVAPPPIASLSISSNVICQGDSVRITLAGPDTLYYNEQEMPENDTLYTFLLDNQGCTVAFTDTLTVYPRPAFSIEGPGRICNGEQAQLIASTGQAGLQFRWNTGWQDSVITVAPLPPSSTYSVTATDPGTGCQSSDSLVVEATPLPPAPIVRCSTTYEEVFFGWNYDRALDYSMHIISGPGGTLLNDSTLRVPHLNPGQAVTLELVATDMLGCSSTILQECTATACQLSLSLNAPSDICLFPGTDSVHLSATVTGSFLAGQGSWAGPGILDPEGLFSPLAAGVGHHTLTFAYREGPCSIEDSASLAIYQPLLESMVECEASSNRITFSWPQLTQDSLYEVQVLTGQDGHFTSPTSFVVDGLISEEEVALAISALGGGGCGRIEVSKTCRAAYCERPARGISQAICAGDTTQLSAAPLTAASFSWEPSFGLSCTDCPFPMASPDTTTTYTRTATDTSGCIYTSTLTLGVEEWPEELIPNVLYVCPGAPFFFCLPDSRYEWTRVNGERLPGHCLSFPSPSPDIQGLYYFSAQRTEQCRINGKVLVVYQAAGGCGASSRRGNEIVTTGLKAYPNPAGSIFSLQGLELEPEEVQLLNAMGQPVRRWLKPGAGALFSLQGIAPGMYLVRVQTATGTEALWLLVQ